jgi:hypothetical protein
MDEEVMKDLAVLADLDHLVMALDPFMAADLDPLEDFGTISNKLSWTS